MGKISVKEKYEEYFGQKVEHSTSTHDAYDVVDFVSFLLEEREHKAMVISNNAIYFNDNSDYESALWEILLLFRDVEYREDLKFIEE